MTFSSKFLACLFVSTALLISATPGHAQSSSEINALLRKSKFVDTGREVNTVVGKDVTTISTFSHPQATDQDCKVTALLMLKELRQHYGSIRRIRVFFYDPADIRSYREVSVNQAEVAQVDQGKSLQSVLSQVSVRRAAATPRATNNSVIRQSARGGKLGAQEYASFVSDDGDVSMLCPAGWSNQPSSVYLIKLFTSRRTGNATLTLLRQSFEFAGLPIEDLVNKHEASLKAGGGVKVRVKKSQSCGGTPGIYFEASTTIGVSEGVERSLFLRNSKGYYLLSLATVGMDDREMNTLFQTVINSLRIRG